MMLISKNKSLILGLIILLLCTNLVSAVNIRDDAEQITQKNINAA